MADDAVNNPPAPVADPALLALRDQIDALDSQLLKLLNDRAHVAEQVGENPAVEMRHLATPQSVSTPVPGSWPAVRPRVSIGTPV